MITIKKDSLIPIYIQIYSQIKINILNGTYEPNMRLNPTRILAKELNVSRITIVNAYEKLKNEDLIVSREGSFFYVNPKLKQNYKKKLQAELIDFNPRKYDLDFSDYNALSNEATINAWYKFVRKETEYIDYYDVRYKYSFRGINELLLEVKKICGNYRDYNPNLKQIVIGTGVESTVEIVCSILEGKIKKVAIGNINNIRLIEFLKKFGVEAVGYFELDEEEINELTLMNVDAILVSPSQFRDIGRVLSLEERERILKWAYEKENRYIIENDYCSEYVYTENPPSIISLDTKNKVFYFNSFSKLLGADIRTNYTIVPKVFENVLEEKFWYRSSNTSFFVQWLIYRYMTTNKYDELIRKTKITLIENQKEMINAIRKYFGDKVRIDGTDSGQSICVSLMCDKTKY